MGLTAKKVYAILNGKIKKISGDVSSLGTPLFYAGSVLTADLLPLSPDAGAVYNIEQASIYGAAGTNVAWNGVIWDALGPTVDLSLLLTKEQASELYLTKNQGVENSGKVAGIDSLGNIVPMFPQGFEYDDNTKHLRFGYDPQMVLGAEVQLDNTLTKSGYAADAKVTGDKNKNLKYVTPQMYGAVGDGIHDDTYAFQQALNKNRCVHIPSGTYLVGNLIMPWSVTIRGDSAVTTTLKAKDGTETVLQMNNNTQASAHIYNITIECDNKAKYGIRYPIISIEDSTDMTLYNLLFDEVYVYRATKRCISIESNAIEARMFEVRTMYSGETGCYFRGTDSIFVSCMFAESKQNGLHIFGANNRVSASKSYLNGTTDKHAGFYIQGDTCIVETTEIQQNYSNGIIITGSGNIIRCLMDGNNGIDSNSMLGQVVVYDNSWNNIIDITIMSWKFFNYIGGKMLPQYGIIIKGINLIRNKFYINNGGIKHYYDLNTTPRNNLIPFYVENPNPLNEYKLNGEDYFDFKKIPIKFNPSYKEYGSESIGKKITEYHSEFIFTKSPDENIGARWILNSQDFTNAVSSISNGQRIMIVGKAKVPKNGQAILQFSYKKQNQSSSGWVSPLTYYARGINYDMFYTCTNILEGEETNFGIGILFQELTSKGGFLEGENIFSVRDLSVYIIDQHENEIFDTSIKE